MMKQKDDGQHGLLALLKQERDRKSSIGRIKDEDHSSKTMVLGHLQRKEMSFKDWIPEEKGANR